MDNSGDPTALGELLRTRRSRLAPHEVGLPQGSRRRTPGLRREEVALLAHVSTTYYTYLEQGRPVSPSPQVLDALAAALQMNPAERRYLGTLAHWTSTATAPPVEQIDAGVVDLVDRLEPYPTFVKGRRWDILASNPAARELFTDWDARPPGDRNLLRWMFTDPQAQQVYLEWEAEAQAMLGRFRLAAARHPDQSDFTALIQELRRESEHVRAWWPRHHVVAIGSGTKKLRHPRHGPQNYSHLVLQVADHPDHTMVTYTQQA